MNKVRFHAVALHGCNGFTLLYGLPPSHGYGVEAPDGELVRSKKKTRTERIFKTAKGARISAALRNRNTGKRG